MPLLSVPIERARAVRRTRYNSALRKHVVCSALLNNLVCALSPAPTRPSRVQADNGPNFPPIRFGWCYRCGRFNLSILNASRKSVKLFDCEELKPSESLSGSAKFASRQSKWRFFCQNVTAGSLSSIRSLGNSNHQRAQRSLAKPSSVAFSAESRPAFRRFHH
jgi:hypothetical protein